MEERQHVTRLEYQEKEILLIATAHVSQDSVELVRRVIEEEQPDSVCIELDADRYHNLKNPKAWENTDVVKVIKEKRVGFLLANLALSSYQKRIAKNLGTTVGGEMLQGMQSAEETGAQLVLADRNIQTTFLRIWRSLRFTEKAKLLFSLIFSLDEEEEITDETIAKMMEQDMLESVMDSLHGEFPKIAEILVSERDQYLAAKIKEAPGPKVVAVLGGAHVSGVSKELYKEQDLDALTYLPPKGKVSKVVKWIIPAIIIALLIYAFAVNFRTGLQSLSIWILWNGTLAALFTALCLGHPLSILTAFLAAPISSINPLLACGWFAGLVEASIKKPTVEDIQNVPDDIFSLKGFFRNRFLKILMVVIMANLGSTIGTFVAGSGIIRNIF